MLGPMRSVRAALYMAAALAASAGVAQEADLAALLTGDMRKLALHEAPEAVPETAFADETGAEMTLSDLAGEVAVVNFWATWCAPCREEMPTLAALEAALGEEGVRVATIAVGRQDPLEVDRFLGEAEEGSGAALPRWRDANQALARDMGVLGLPVTVILDREGREVARLQGDADWSSESAVAVLRALAAQ
jgi:thiol-disulfide isomerase/thioredoxin